MVSDYVEFIYFEFVYSYIGDIYNGLWYQCYNYTVPIIIDSFYPSGGENVSLPFEK